MSDKSKIPLPDPIAEMLATHEMARQMALDSLLASVPPEGGQVSRAALIEMVCTAFNGGAVAEYSKRN